MSDKTSHNSDFIIVAVGTLTKGFELYGPARAPKTEQDNKEIQTAIIREREHLGKDSDPFRIITGKFDQDAETKGQYVVVTGDIESGFQAKGLFNSEEGARKSMSGFHHMSCLLTPVDCSLSIG